MNHPQHTDRAHPSRAAGAAEPAAASRRRGGLLPRSRPARRTLIAAGTALAVLLGGSYAATSIMDIPSPLDLVRLQTTPPSGWGELFPARSIAKAGHTTALPTSLQAAPEHVPWKGKRITFKDFLSKTRTNAFLVLRDGKVTYEWYGDGFTADTRMPSWSVAKSVVSLLVGQAIERGKLRESDRLVDLLPELRSKGTYDTITVRNLLDMTSGIDVDENYSPWRPFTGTARMMLTRDLRTFVKDHRDLTYTPGSQASYRSVDTMMLGLILMRVEKKPLAELLSEGIWKPVGATHTATWNLDREDGVEKAFCGLNATARDFAKIGQLVLDKGSANGQQIIPEKWVTRLATPAPHRIDNWGYSAQWWRPSGGNGKDFSAIGIYGQYVYVAPDARTVIVKMSDHGTQQDEQETVDALRSIAQHND
ncbi:beta-lactamase family protein [Streptomyces platensis]|uniref:serine hydrolase domain-containing protein n=1 Tax=Streptomyces platensis TaxID=58346 RepID=UPI00224ECA3B|nr:serine hydrolase [Streptomyces platensis]MCX4640874.1 beta-lactamase family protein [Streptomyces platensis]